MTKNLESSSIRLLDYALAYEEFEKAEQILTSLKIDTESLQKLLEENLNSCAYLKSANWLLAHGAKIIDADKVLFDSTKKSNRDFIDLALNHGANINAKDESGRTPLMYAVSAQDVEVSEMLIKRGADVNEKDNDKRTPLMYVLSNRYTTGSAHLSITDDVYGRDIAEMLIKSGADIHAKYSRGKHFDYVNGKLEDISYLDHNLYDLAQEHNNLSTLKSIVPKDEFEKLRKDSNYYRTAKSIEPVPGVKATDSPTLK